MSAQDAKNSVILIPEGIIKLKGTGLEVIRLCDGRRTLGEIIAQLKEHFKNPNVAKDVEKFLAKLAERKVISLDD